jgi:adenylosuccinate synthase
VKYAVDLCGVTSIALTLLDVLSGLDHIQVCTGYRINGKRMESFRADMDGLVDAEPIYETLPGWRADISGIRQFAELPAEAQKYVKHIEQLCGVPISMVSVGPERSATLLR